MTEKVFRLQCSETGLNAQLAPLVFQGWELRDPSHISCQIPEHRLYQGTWFENYPQRMSS